VEVAAGGDEAIEFKSRSKLAFVLIKTINRNSLNFVIICGSAKGRPPPAADNETQSKQSKCF
jgi:hypothetical protein